MPLCENQLDTDLLVQENSPTQFVLLHMQTGSLVWYSRQRCLTVAAQNWGPGSLGGSDTRWLNIKTYSIVHPGARYL